MTDQLRFEVVTQEKHLLKETVDAVSVPAVSGEITILPHHISLFTKLSAGEIRYQKADRWISYFITGGFMDVSGGKIVTIMADSAVRSDQINLARAEEAKKRAEDLLQEKRSTQEFIIAEAELRKAVLELQVGKKYKGRQATQA